VKSPMIMARECFFAAANLFAYVAEVVEAVVSPHGGNERGEDGRRSWR